MTKFWPGNYNRTLYTSRQFLRRFLKTTMAHAFRAFRLHRAGGWNSDLMAGVGADMSGQGVTMTIGATMAERQDQEGRRT